ncbi:FliO/MopB family protein [Parvibaculum sp.]|jgi:flagellar protein FliO/FliZ|uniref:FliO/MopB family protein n=1 Tax=Parvibaculum sp. TaxID=2024848 RepID=UPI0039197A39
MDFSEIFRFVAALAFILGLIGLCAMLAKRFGLAPGVTSAGSNRRVGIVEVRPVDAKHRLLLIRRDGKEHLILMGGEHPLLIESGIDAPEEPAAMPAANKDKSPRPAFTGPAHIVQLQRFVEYIKERRA